jgi:putative PIN family toxin of toxin-antitoxin system
MVILQGAGRPGGPACACLTLVDDDRVELILSETILAEVRDVLRRPKTRQKFPLLTAEWVDEFTRDVTRKSIVLADVPSAYALPRDPKDERYLDVAIAANAEFLVSRDLDLLDLMKDAAFCQKFPRLTVLDPAAFLKVMANRDLAEQPPTDASASE